MQKLIESNHESVIMSPYSVATALALLSAGAKGASFEEIKASLHLSGDQKAIADSFSESSTELRSKVGEALLEIANKLYLKNGVEINPEYKDIALQKFNSELEAINFAESTQSADKINYWVEEKTNKRIQNLISPSDLNADTQLVLVNAIYFKGLWKEAFNEQQTSKLPFWLDETHSEDTDVMSQTNKFLYGEFADLGFSALRMSYEKSDLSMLVLLPIKRTGLADLEKNLHSFELKNITSRMSLRKVDVNLPKFKIESNINLNEILKMVCPAKIKRIHSGSWKYYAIFQLGVNEVFNNGADLSNILSNGVPVKVSNMIHKAFVEVDEKGAEAAAATGYSEKI